jgi:hypothetical protein
LAAKYLNALRRNVISIARSGSANTPKRTRTRHERPHGFANRDFGQPGDVNQPKEPKDATKSTEEQRQLQEELEHQDDDPDAPGLHQSQRNTPDESTR